VGWRVEAVEGEGIRIGARDSRLGGPYDGPGASLRLEASLDLHWSDGQQTRGNLDRQSILDPASVLDEWRASAFRERSGGLPALAGPTALPDVQTVDPRVADAVRGEPSRLLEPLGRVVERVLAAGSRRVDGSLRASFGRRTVATSAGFRGDWEETTFSLGVWADEIAHAGFGRRCLPAADELDTLVASAVTLAAQLASEQALPGAARGVLLMPGIVHAVLDRLLLPNLAGRGMRDGRSPFTLADVDSGREIARPDLDLIADTTLPLELTSAPAGPDGVPAGRVALVEGGRLVSPLLDFATAAELGRPATPIGRTRPRAFLASRTPSLSLEDALRELGDGVVARDLPGLHTQLPRRMRYAVIVPDAQAVANGVAGGRCRVRLAGNLLDHLSQPSTRLVHVPGEPGLGLLVQAGAEILPA